MILTATILGRLLTIRTFIGISVTPKTTKTTRAIFAYRVLLIYFFNFYFSEQGLSHATLQICCVLYRKLMLDVKQIDQKTCLLLTFLAAMVSELYFLMQLIHAWPAQMFMHLYKILVNCL